MLNGSFEVPVLSSGTSNTVTSSLQGWTVENLSQEDAERNVRSRRDTLLAESDWTQVADAPVDQAAWATYRQALRDVPQQAGFPFSVTWPQEP